MRIRKWMYNLRLRDRFKRYSGLSTQSSSEEKFLRNEKRTSESKGLLCSSQTEWEEIHIGYVFIFISRLRNYSNTPVCAHLFPQGTYKRTKIIPSLARNSSDRVGSQKTGKKGHTAIRQERLGSHRAARAYPSCRGHSRDYLKVCTRGETNQK